MRFPLNNFKLCQESKHWIQLKIFHYVFKRLIYLSIKMMKNTTAVTLHNAEQKVVAHCAWQSTSLGITPACSSCDCTWWECPFSLLKGALNSGFNPTFKPVLPQVSSSLSVPILISKIFTAKRMHGYGLVIIQKILHNQILFSIHGYQRQEN